jgi:hypothetical protein
MGVVHQLGSEDREVADAARDALTRRGFSPVQLELAGQLIDPDPNVRKNLVEILPGLQSVAPEPWLWQLSQDPDAAVRRAAVAAREQLQAASVEGAGLTDDAQANRYRY